MSERVLRWRLGAGSSHAVRAAVTVLSFDRRQAWSVDDVKEFHYAHQTATEKQTGHAVERHCRQSIVIRVTASRNENDFVKRVTGRTSQKYAVQFTWRR